tara:strand:- start:433 stop:2283 length:1851 start_codon:yes stop_codon:yes gene_type:complete
MSKRAPRPPAPPPDYTKEKAQFAESEFAARKKQADEYNRAVGAFNQSLGGFRPQIDDFADRVGGLGIADYTDGGREFTSGLSGLRRNVSGLNFSRAKPSFESTVNSPWGAVSVGQPTFQNANEGLRSQMLSDISGIGSQLSGLASERRSEEGRVRGFRSGLLGELGGLGDRISQTGIGDERGINQLGSELSGLSSRLASFESPIASQMYGSGDQLFPTIQGSIGGARTGVEDLRNRRSDELQRISDFRSQQRGGYDALRERFDPFTIADESGINEVLRDIDRQRLGIQRFDSPISTDFSNTTSNLGDLYGDAQSLLGERRREVDRISEAERQARSGARAIRGEAQGANIYSAAGLNALEDAIGDVRDQTAGFSSVLPFDFTSANQNVGEAETQLAALREQRGESLDDLLARAGATSGGIASIPLQNEEAIRERLSSLSGVGADLAPFSGGRVGEVQTQLDASRGILDNRLAELQTRRGEIETEAQALLEQVGADSFTDFASIEARLDELGLVQEKQQLFAAKQALDEIAQIEQSLNQERQRLEADREASDFAKLQERREILAALGPGGVPQFQDATSSAPLTAAEYLSLLARNPDEEEQLAAAGSPFSSSLGVIRV